MQKYKKFSIFQIHSELNRRLREEIIRLDLGVHKLNEAKVSVNQLKVDLVNKESELQDASAEAEKVLQTLTSESVEAERARNRVQQVKDRCEGIVKMIDTEREAAQLQLDQAKPALDDALSSINAIRQQDITTLRKLAKPPHLIMRMMDCIIILLNHRISPVKPDHDKKFIMTSWSEALRLIMNSNFLNSLLNYPLQKLNEEHMDLMEPYFNNPDYNYNVAKKVCGNISGILSWTLALYKYYWIGKTVIPIQIELEKLERKFAKANREYKKVEKELKEQTDMLVKVQQEYEKVVNRKMFIEQNARMCFERISTVRALIDALSNEMNRWFEKSSLCKRQLIDLSGDTIQFGAILTYCGSFTLQIRSHLMKKWREELLQRSIPHDQNPSLIKTFTDQATVSYTLNYVSYYLFSIHIPLVL